MNPQQSAGPRRLLTAAALLAAAALLLWEHFNGGVASHHLLQRADMPAISNWWSVVVLPVLTWLSIGRVQQRIARDPGAAMAAARVPAGVVAGFVGALLFGILLSVAFTYGHDAMASYLFRGLILLALLLPVYRAECVLGFVLGMTFTFGAVLPTVIGGLIAAVSALVHLYVRPALARLLAWFRHARLPAA